MSDELRRSDRNVERLDYAVLGSTGERVARVSSASSLNETFDIELSEDAAHHDFPLTNRSSSESTLTPGSSDTGSQDVTLTADSPEFHSATQLSPFVESTTNSFVSLPNPSQISHPVNLLSNVSGPLSTHWQLVEPPSMLSNVNHQLLDALTEIDNTLTMAAEDAKATYTRINLIVEDLNDFMDEHSMHDPYITVEDIDTRIKHVEEVRSTFRELQ